MAAKCFNRLDRQKNITLTTHLYTYISSCISSRVLCCTADRPRTIRGTHSHVIYIIDTRYRLCMPRIVHGRSAAHTACTLHETHVAQDCERRGSSMDDAGHAQPVSCIYYVDYMAVSAADRPWTIRGTHGLVSSLYDARLSLPHSVCLLCATDGCGCPVSSMGDTGHPQAYIVYMYSIRCVMLFPHVGLVLSFSHNYSTNIFSCSTF